MTHLFDVHVKIAANKYKPAVACICIVCRKVAAVLLFPMPNSRDTDPILPTTNMAGGNNKDGKKKRVLVVGAGAAGTVMKAWPEVFSY